MAIPVDYTRARSWRHCIKLALESPSTPRGVCALASTALSVSVFIYSAVPMMPLFCDDAFSLQLQQRYRRHGAIESLYTLEPWYFT